MTVSEYFSSDYAEARARILAAAEALRHAAHRNPYARGPRGEELFIDVLVHGPQEASDALLITSATHGVEGFAGSGVQLGLLRSGLLGTAPPGTKIVLVHALNPYGFCWLRRVNEDNVDLNRNCLDHGAPPPENADYAALAHAIAPPVWSEDALAPLRAELRAFAQVHGPFRLQEAITRGQYGFPGGLYYGGHKEAWSIGVLRHVVLRELARARRVIMLDIHTGLGASGALEIMSEFAPEDPRYLRAKSWWCDRVKTSATGESLSAHLSGTLDGFLPPLLPRAEVTFAALEYGTSPPEAVFRALQADNWLHIHGDPMGPEAPAIKAEIRKAFYPDTPEWKEAVWSSAEGVIARGLEALAS